jgi:hypothetical protein
MSDMLTNLIGNPTMSRYQISVAFVATSLPSELEEAPKSLIARSSSFLFQFIPTPNQTMRCLDTTCFMTLAASRLTLHQRIR